MHGGMKGRFLVDLLFLFFSMFDVYHLSVMGKLENKPRIYQYSYRYKVYFNTTLGLHLMKSGNMTCGEMTLSLKDTDLGTIHLQ